VLDEHLAEGVNDASAGSTSLPPPLDGRRQT